MGMEQVSSPLKTRSMECAVLYLDVAPVNVYTRYCRHQ